MQCKLCTITTHKLPDCRPTKRLFPPQLRMWDARKPLRVTQIYYILHEMPHFPLHVLDCRRRFFDDCVVAKTPLTSVALSILDSFQSRRPSVQCERNSIMQSITIGGAADKFPEDVVRI